MADYLGVTKVKELGRRVCQLEMPETQPEVPKGTILVAVLDSLVSLKAVNVTNPNRYKDFREYQFSGTYPKVDLYLLEEKQIADCPDEGEVMHPGMQDIATNYFRLKHTLFRTSHK